MTFKHFIALRRAAALCGIVGIFAPFAVQANDLPEFKPRDRAPLSVHETGASVSVIGEDEEKGLLEVFVRKNNNLQAREDAIARDLSGVEPAAGIQFRLEF